MDRIAGHLHAVGRGAFADALSGRGLAGERKEDAREPRHHQGPIVSFLIRPSKNLVENLILTKNAIHNAFIFSLHVWVILKKPSLHVIRYPLHIGKRLEYLHS